MENTKLKIVCRQAKCGILKTIETMYYSTLYYLYHLQIYKLYKCFPVKYCYTELHCRKNSMKIQWNQLVTPRAVKIKAWKPLTIVGR